VSIAAVALLAGTANMIARESVQVMRTVIRPARIEPVASLAGPQPQTASIVPILKKANALSAAVDNYQQVTQAWAVRDSLTNQSDFTAAKDALQVATLEFISGSSTAKGLPLAATQQVPRYLDEGRVLMELSSRRRRARIDYVGYAKCIADGIQSSLAGAWTLFGRVIARQSLIAMRADLDAIRQHSEPLVAGESIDQGRTDPLITGELQFARLLDANAATLEKSEGPQWLQMIRENFDQLVSTRKSLQSLNLQYDHTARQFALDGRLLTAQITGAYAGWDREDNAQSGTHSYLEPSRQPISAGGATPEASIVKTTVERTDPDAARLMAIVTTFVMSLVVAISVLIVRSIVVPVKRLVKAANQLATGNSNVLVGRGGIEELDSLAQAFNAMSTQLQAMRVARDHQQANLEKIVMERTLSLQQLALQDPLTSLPNRRHLTLLLNSAIDRAARDNRFVGVYFLDIDNFKNINDSVGHAFGDRVLMSVANRLEELTDGFGFVARLGGDEFTIVFEDAGTIDAIHELGGSVARAFQQVLSVDDRELSLSVSVGASIFPLHETDADALLRAADAALFRAKELGRSQLAVFTPELITTAAKRFSIEQGLRRAVDRAEFELVYQPEINCGTAEMELVEALLRWRLPDGHIARPGEFLVVAEQSGIIAEIDAWVLRAAVADAARWYHGLWSNARVAINVSSRQLLDHRFVDKILALVSEFRLPTACIEFELTETAFQTGPITISCLRTLRSLGFGIALDDFGTGYSSLTSLEELPLSRIKLDRSLVARIDTSESSAAIARAIVDLCAGLKLQVTAEGIERPEQLAWFFADRSILLQGYLLSDAVPFEQVSAVKELLVNKMQDLLFSARSPSERPAVATLEDKISASR
jgi:diguanylate cyclase (GGDEF)-like protein